ncbi:MAG: MBL fold metallo-hydrolase [Bifidobacteriaceae bacterium]|jgi:glyoxylase-like metal-dependent hydrolase (beta-lactamase superfamily II)|nr:MBL fold metallo-hydrolase [Bifidobacteriaceae bacterium]
MRVRRYGQIAQLTLWAAIFPVNCYLVREEDGFTLVDTTLAVGAPGVARVVGDRVRDSGAPLRRIALTHAHQDHIGGLDRLRAAFPDCQVLLPARSVPILAGDLGLLEGEAPGEIRGRYRPVATVPDVLLEDGDRVGSLEVVVSPGHSPDSVSFRDVRDGALICGDAFQTKGGLAVSGDRRTLFPWVAAATWSLPTAIASARRLAGLDPSRLMPGHGDVLADPAGAVASVIERAGRLDALQGA